MNKKQLLSICMALLLFIVYVIPSFADEKQSHQISKKDARKKAQEFLEKNLNLDINERNLELCYDYPVKNKVESYISYSDYRLCWKFYTSIKKEDKTMEVNVYIDSNRGKVSSMEIKKNEQESKETLISKEDAELIARKFIKKANPQQYSEILLAEEKITDSNGEYTFYFDRYTNEVIFNMNLIRVSIDKITGQVIYYGLDWDDGINFLYGKEHAQEAAKSFLKKYYDFQDESISISFDYDKPIRNHYYGDHFGWEMTVDIVEGDKSYYSFICVSVFTGEVVYITIDEKAPWEEGKIITKKSNDEARTIAEDFLKKVAPEKFKETIFTGEYNTPGEVGASFHFARIINGIIYDENFLELSIDVSNGKVRFYGWVWDENIIFQDTQGIISEEEAIKIMSDKLNLFIIIHIKR